MKYLQFGVVLLLLPLSIYSQNTDTMEEKKIMSLVQECYINGALNEMNTEEMRRGYHKDFAIFFKNGDALQKLPLENWISLVENYKTDDTKVEGLRDFTAEIKQVDITNDAAFVKLILIRNNELVFTDYITLLKFKEQWKIVTKIYHSHVENPWKL